MVAVKLQCDSASIRKKNRGDNLRGQHMKCNAHVTYMYMKYMPRKIECSCLFFIAAKFCT